MELTMPRLCSGLIIGLAAALAACGGGSSGGAIDGPDGGSTNLSASFSPAEPNPGTDTVSMGQPAASGSLVTIKVLVTDTGGIYGAAFDLTYDPSLVRFENWHAGSFLEQGGHSPAYQVDATRAGRLVVGVARQGSVGSVDASGSRTLIELTFRAREAGTSQIAFQNATLFDDQLTPQGLSGIVWQGGTVIAN
jgi:hypothetical protein